MRGTVGRGSCDLKITATTIVTVQIFFLLFLNFVETLIKWWHFLFSENLEKVKTLMVLENFSKSNFVVSWMKF